MCRSLNGIIRPRCLRALVAASVFILLGAGGSAWAQSAFYRASERELVGPPGTIIRQEPMMFAPSGAAACRVLYRSTGLHDEPIAVSGIIVIPPGPAPEGGRPIVAWAHPTTGIVPRCAPSLAIFHFQQIQGLRDMVERGNIVAATDYPGLGTVGPHPYLVGISEGRAVLDSVRAARGMAGAAGANRIRRMGTFARWAGSPLRRVARRKLCPGDDARRRRCGRTRHRPRNIA